MFHAMICPCCHVVIVIMSLVEISAVHVVPQYVQAEKPNIFIRFRRKEQHDHLSILWLPDNVSVRLSSFPALKRFLRKSSAFSWSNVTANKGSSWPLNSNVRFLARVLLPWPMLGQLEVFGGCHAFRCRSRVALIFVSCQGRAPAVSTTGVGPTARVAPLPLPLKEEIVGAGPALRA